MGIFMSLPILLVAVGISFFIALPMMLLLNWLLPSNQEIRKKFINTKKGAK